MTRFPSIGALGKDKLDAVLLSVAQRAVVHPSCDTNEGCDVVGVLDTDGGNGVVLLFLECKYTVANYSQFEDKALKTLNGLAELLEASGGMLGGRSVRHVGFGMVRMGGGRMGTLGAELRNAMNKVGSYATVSLHACSGANELQRLLTPPIYHVVPDKEYYDPPAEIPLAITVQRGR